MSFWKPDVCVYHGGCDDGFGAAWFVRRMFGENVRFVPGSYGRSIEWPSDLHDANVLFVDFSLKREQMIELANGGLVGCIPRSIVVLDHHKTAEAELVQWNIGPVIEQTSYPRLLDNIAQATMEQAYPIVAHFDMNSSGAAMAWQMFSGEQANSPPPNLIALIEDRDLWRFAYGDRTRQFSAALRTYPQDFEVWDGLAARVEDLVEEGAAILRGHEKTIGEFCRHAYEMLVGGYVVPVVNVPYHYASDTANALLKRFPAASFAACWFQVDSETRQFSLRSDDDRLDVSLIAKKFGGGGHRNAAGFILKKGSELS